MTIESCLHLIFESIISEIGSNTVLAISGNVRIQKKKVSCTCVSLVFAEALLLSEQGWCWTQVLSENIKPLPVVSLCSNSAWVAQEHTRCLCVCFGVSLLQRQKSFSYCFSEECVRCTSTRKKKHKAGQSKYTSPLGLTCRKP